MVKNYGIDLAREQSEQSPEDWQFGALSLPSLINIPQGERENFLPQGEVQRGREDFVDCASRAPVNKLEADFTYGYQNKRFKPENLKWLEDNGYVQDGRILFSDRFIAIKSKTTRQGNSMKAPLDAINNSGLIPKSLLPKLPDMTFDEYHDSTSITKEMEDLGKEFLKRWDINYEKVYAVHSGELLKEDMLCAAGYAWPTPINGEYPKPESFLSPNHEFLKFALPKTFIFDNYEESPNDFIKKLVPDYTFYDYDYRVFISGEYTPEERSIQLSVFQVLLQYGLLAFFADFWEKFNKAIGKR